MIYDFVWGVFLDKLEFWGILDSLILDLDMICITYISFIFAINSFVFAPAGGRPISRLPNS